MTALYKRILHTVKLIYKDNPKCGPFTQVVSIRRFNNIESIPFSTCKMWSLKQLGFMYNWSSEKV